MVAGMPYTIVILSSFVLNMFFIHKLLFSQRFWFLVDFLKFIIVRRCWFKDRARHLFVFKTSIRITLQPFLPLIFVIKLIIKLYLRKKI